MFEPFFIYKPRRKFSRKSTVVLNKRYLVLKDHLADQIKIFMNVDHNQKNKKPKKIDKITYVLESKLITNEKKYTNIINC